MSSPFLNHPSYQGTQLKPLHPLGLLASHLPLLPKLTLWVGCNTTKTSKWLLWPSAGIAIVYTAITISSAPSFALTTFGDIAQLVLSAIVTIAFGLRIRSARGRIRSFWVLMTTGVGCWWVSNAIWSYYEIVARINVVDPSIQDIILFLHLIPMMAALATLPHQQRKIPSVMPYTLGMIGVWWMYLYSYVVVPWQYVMPSVARYGGSFNTLYTLEDVAFIIGLVLLAFKCTGAWRTLYSRLLLGSLGYTISAHVINAAIDKRIYYTGSYFDLPLILSIICIGWAASSARTNDVSEELPEDLEETHSAGWLTRIAFFALLSVPVLAAWSLEFGDLPDVVRDFRVVVSLIAIVALGTLLFFVQRILSERLKESLASVNDSLEKLAAAREALQHQATHDSMTGALNRSAIVDALDRELGRASRSESKVAVLMIDLDHFKEINDRFGHHAGDVAIIEASTRMRDSVRAHDLVGRYGGEEFLAVIPEADYPIAVQIAERIRQELAAKPMKWNSNEITVTVTIGVALSRPGDTSEKLLRRADVALYSGKIISRDTIQLADQDTVTA
jgi:diguanylate cyclase (GGDEF)-like protein